MHKRLLNKVGLRQSNGLSTDHSAPQGDSPEARIIRDVRAFCESGGPNILPGGEGYLHLPTIVEAAESSPQAAAQAANEIRRFLSTKNSSSPATQYNAIMLIRILSDNPGPSFTRNLDAKFVSLVKQVLRESRDASTQQLLRDTLDHLERSKSNDPTMAPLLDMWRKSKAKYGQPQMQAPPLPLHPNQAPAPTWSSNNPNYFAHRSHGHGLPSQSELAQRIEEAKTSAKLLAQLVQSTAPEDVVSHELIKEFAERCQAAARSMQTYINATNPQPDEDTLLTLIDTNDQLSTALSRYQRSMLQGRRLKPTSSDPANTNDVIIRDFSPSQASHGQGQGPFEVPADVPSQAFTQAPNPFRRTQPTQPSPAPTDPFSDNATMTVPTPPVPSGLQTPLVPTQAHDSPGTAITTGQGAEGGTDKPRYRF